jgi:putative FmdB family regulatory protein
MPIYEFRCRACRKRYTTLTLRISEAVEPQCPHCGSRAADRLMSRFAMPRSEADRLDALADPSNLGDLDADDPRSVGRWMRKMGREMGEDLGDDLDELAEEAERGDDGDETGGGADDA